MELIPDLPEEIAMECLIRLPYNCHQSAKQVSRRWKELIDDRDFFYQRKESGNTNIVACLVQSLPWAGEKPVGPPVYGITVFDPKSGQFDRLEPIPKYPYGIPLFCQLVGTEGKLVVMGGWDPSSWEPVRHVFVYDFAMRRWTQGKDMPGARSFFAAGAVDGQIVIAGGHDENKNALRSAYAYDFRRDEWKQIAEMGEERDECEGVVFGGEFWVVSGYSTERQGNFGDGAEVYDFAEDRWRTVERAWDGGKCPRATVGSMRDGKLVCWGEEDVVRVGVCVVGLGVRVLVMGSVCPGAPFGFYLVDGNRKLERVNVGQGFEGFVQSGCCMEI